MTIILLVIICALAFFQLDFQRRTIAMIYAVLCAVHVMLCVELVGFWYYASAAVFDLAIVSLIYSYGARVRLTDDLINISVASVALNFYGWLTWFNYQPPLSYNLAMTALYFIAILSILRKDCANGNQPYKWGNSIRLCIGKGVDLCYPKQKEAGT